MDLLEQTGGTASRHPWELARLDVIERLVARTGPGSGRLLDIGCGDGFVLRSLSRHFAHCVGVDTHLSERQCRELSRDNVEFRASAPPSTEPNFDLLLLLDVLEHVEKPVPFLAELVRGQLRKGGWAILTVPAFSALFSAHDVELRHFRRYRRSQAASEALSAGLHVVDSGYFFASLLPARALTVLKERVLPAAPPQPNAGVGLGRWRGGPLLTRAVAGLLRADAHVGFEVNRWGLHLPGLSAWLLCQRRSET